MKKKRLETILAEFPHRRVLVLGDFFLDEYLTLDRTLSEPSLETGLEAFQVVGRCVSPGGAGTVAANLRALGADVVVLGVAGDDGRGMELRRALSQMGADTADLLTVPGWMTATYTKPMMREPDGTTHELNRLDCRSRRPLPFDVPYKLMARLWARAVSADAVVVGDQIADGIGAVVSGAMRAVLEELGRTERRILVDSRARAHRFHNVSLKVNLGEALAATGAKSPEAAAEKLFEQTGKPAFVTLGADGTLVCTANGITRLDSIAIPPPTDPVGAGDAAMAGIALALCVGASLAEAAEIGNLAAAVTVAQIGTTGIATRDAILRLTE